MTVGFLFIPKKAYAVLAPFPFLTIGSVQAYSPDWAGMLLTVSLIASRNAINGTISSLVLSGRVMMLGLTDKIRVRITSTSAQIFSGIFVATAGGGGFALFSSSAILSDTTSLSMAISVTDSGKTIEYTFSTKWFRGLFIIGGFTDDINVEVSDS